MSRAIQARLLDRIKSRSVWEDRQRVWYDMLKHGLDRRNKPFPNAANLHLPLADNAVEKLKPYYTVDIFSRQTICSFTSLKQDMGSATSAAAECLHWNLRYQSNFPLETCYNDHMKLGHGRAVMKCTWDHRARGGKGKLRFESIDPLYFIGQAECSEIDEMDLFCHVKQVTVDRYKRSKQYQKKDEDFIARIKGGQNQIDQFKDQEKEVREGITSTKNEDLIILWETWRRTEKGWRVSTFSPSAPDEPVRPDFLYPLTWDSEPLQPFVEWQIEYTEKGWFAPRGVTEKVAAFEYYGTKMWNQQADWLEYAKNPIFTRDLGAPVTSTNMTKLAPGTVFPPGVSPIAMPPPPIAFDEEINRNRMLAEETAQVPDFGVTPEGDTKESRTATEMQYVGSFASQGIQYRVTINSFSEAKLYKIAWATLIKWGGEEIVYMQADSRKVLPAQARHDQYLLEPNTSPNAGNQQQKAQRAVTRYQLLKDHPNINQEELVKTLIEADDARLVKRLVVGAGQRQKTEAEDEAFEIAIMLLGFPAVVNAGEDHQTRLQTLFGALQLFSMMPPPATPLEMTHQRVGIQRIQAHIAEHTAALQQENPALAKQFQGAIAEVDPTAAAGPQTPGEAMGAAQLPSAEEQPMEAAAV